MRCALSAVAAITAIALIADVSAASAVPVPGAAKWGGGGACCVLPEQVPGFTGAVQVAAGEGLDFALLGSGTVTNDGALPLLSGASAVSAGGKGGLAIVSGAAKEVGQQPSHTVAGQLTTFSAWSTVPRLEAGITAVSEGVFDRFAAGRNEDLGIHDLALKAGQVYAWGDNEKGQIGNGTESYALEPEHIELPEEAVAVAAGGGQSLALLRGGTVYAWGENELGQLGDGKLGKKFNSTTPVKVAGLSGVVAIAAGGEDSLALLENGTVFAWGSNKAGELGTGATGLLDSSEPIQVVGLSGVSAIAAGPTHGATDFDHNYALLTSGKVLAWGRGSDGEDGNGTKEGTATPVEVSISHVTSISAGQETGLASGPLYPSIEAVSPTHGPVTGETEVTIKGKNLEEATSVEFGGNKATILEDTEEAMRVLTPTGAPKKVKVTVTTSFGSAQTASVFLYEPIGVIEFGRCLNLGKGLGSYSSAKCTEAEAGGKFEWTTEIAKRGFTIAQKEKVALETAGGTLVTCRGTGGGHGEYAGTKGVANVTIDLTECTEGTSSLKSTPKCSSPGAAEGEIRTSTLEGEIGYDNRELNNVALSLSPAEEGGPFTTFVCGVTTTTVRGIVFGSISPVNSATTSTKLAYGGSKGKQKIEGFEGGPGNFLEALSTGGLFVKANINGSFSVTNEEAIEINTVA
jgi:hypothetical protein